VIGRILDGRYEVLGPLGEGGMAIIYRGRRADDGRPVAIKILRDQYAHNAEFVARFEREAQAVARLSHPHMVQVYDWGRDGDVHYIVMEFVEGDDLKTLLRRAGRVNEVRAREIAEQVCDALQYAHTQGIVHRDIKPQNILIDRSGRVKVTDFGIARALASTTITETGTVLGSVQYLSPEQARGFGVGHTADLYSLGVVLYEMVTGTLPFDGDTPITIALKHMQEPVPAPRRDGRPLTPSMEGIILKALAKAPEARYRTAAEMQSDLLGASEHWRTRGPDVESTSLVRPRRDGAAGPSARAAAPFIAAAIVLLAVFVGIAAGWQALNAYLNVPEVKTPDFVGHTLPEAQTVAREDRIGVQVVQQVNSATVPAGWVVGQDPPAGQAVKVNRVIALTTSLGPVMLSVPDVRRRSVEEARFTIEASQLVVGELREAYDDTVPSGFIVSQDPAPGASIERGAAVNLTISKGTAVVVLPDLVGMSLDQARRTLQDLGVTLREVIQAPRDDVPPGQIVAMTPAAGTQIQHGDAVGVTIAVRSTPNGTQAPPPQPIVTATPPAPVSASAPVADRRVAHVKLVVPAGPSHQLVKIVVIDQQGVHVVYQGNRGPGENIERDVTGIGYTIVQVYIDDRLIQEIRP